MLPPPPCLFVAQWPTVCVRVSLGRRPPHALTGNVIEYESASVVKRLGHSLLG